MGSKHIWMPCWWYFGSTSTNGPQREYLYQPMKLLLWFGSEILDYLFYDFLPCISCKCKPSYVIFHDRVEQFYDATWVGVECHNCCMNGRNLWIVHIPSSSPILDFPTSFSNLGKSQIIVQWSTSILHLLECAYTIVWSTFETIVNDHKTFPHT